MPRQCVFYSQLASDHSTLGIGQAMAPALRVQTDTPRMDLGLCLYQGCVSKPVLEDMALTQDHKGLGGWRLVVGMGISGGGYSRKSGGMVNNKEYSKSSVMKPLCWVLLLRTSGVKLSSKRARVREAVSAAKPTALFHRRL